MSIIYEAGEFSSWILIVVPFLLVRWVVQVCQAETSAIG